MITFVRLLPSVNQGMSFQSTALTEGYPTLWTQMSLGSTVGLLVVVKASSACKCFGTQFTRKLVCHPRLSVCLHRLEKYIYI